MGIGVDQWEERFNNKPLSIQYTERAFIVAKLFFLAPDAKTNVL